MRWKRLFFGLIAAFSYFVEQAGATVVDHPHFRVDGIVIVWAGEAGDAAPISGGALGQIGQTVTTRVSAPPFMGNGELVPIGRGALVPAGPVSSERHFFVASNTAFSIDAELSSRADAAALDTVDFDLSTHLGRGAIGGAAQYPHRGGSRGGVDQSVRTLADLVARRTVFRGTRATAARRGTIMEQSVRFDVAIDAPTRKPLPDLVFSVYVP